MADLKPDDKTLEALVRLGNDGDFKMVAEWLVRARIDELEACAAVGPEPEVRKHQGRAAILKEIIDVFMGARERLDRRRENAR